MASVSDKFAQAFLPLNFVLADGLQLVVIVPGKHDQEVDHDSHQYPGDRHLSGSEVRPEVSNWEVLELLFLLVVSPLRNLCVLVAFDF